MIRVMGHCPQWRFRVPSPWSLLYMYKKTLVPYSAMLHVGCRSFRCLTYIQPHSTLTFSLPLSRYISWMEPSSKLTTKSIHLLLCGQRHCHVLCHLAAVPPEVADPGTAEDEAYGDHDAPRCWFDVYEVDVSRT